MTDQIAGLEMQGWKTEDHIICNVHASLHFRALQLGPLFFRF